MGCVAKNSKEFKSLAARNNVDSGLLELIVHKYWVETGNETKFPTDVYIQAQLGNTSYKESSPIIRDFWKKRYSKAKTFNSLKAVNAAEREAIKYFPASAVMKYKDAKGKWVLTVKQPVAKVNDADAFFKDEDSMSVKRTHTLDLGLKENQTYGIEKIKELYNLFNTDRTSKALADKIFTIAEDLGLTITFSNSLPFGTMGRYTNNNTIVLKKSFLEREAMTDKKAPIILHEVVHAISMYALSNQTKNWKRPKDLENFRTEMNSIYQDLKSNPLLKGERGVVDIMEFVAELANPIFREKIQNIDRENAANETSQKKSFWQRIVNAFKSLLGITHPTDTYYQRSINALNKALDSFDLDTYMRYNGIKNTLRQGYNVEEWKFKSMSDAEVKSTVTNYFDKEAYNQELQSIKEKAIADGTFMKAPNGKPTNLNERQWLQVRTKNFKEWFGDWENNPENASKVVDENGEPLVVYHGGAKGIKVFQHSSKKDSTTGYGYYTNKKTGEKIPMDSNRTIFFSSNPFVGTSYATMYGIQQFQKLLVQTENILHNSNKETGLHFTTKNFKKGLSDFYEFLTNASEINPRFKALKNYIQNLKAIGKKIDKVNEREAILEMLKDLRKKLQDYTSKYLMNRSEWENIYSDAAKVINEYNNPEGIKRLINGEIPEIILKEWELYKKIEAQREKEGKAEINNYKSTHLTLGRGRYYLSYDGKDLKIWNPYYTDPKVSTMTEEELSRFLAEAKNANLLGFKELREDTNYQAVKNKAQEYAVFLNLRNPISHDYEGTYQGEGYKQSRKYPFGYVAARQVNKAFKEGKDGVIYQNLYDPYLADNYGVFNPNQVKSATDNTGEFSTINPEIYNYEIGNSSNENTFRTELKPEYKGKLIYAQSGTGKSSIADNVTVFDSDYILGEILGVSPQTAGFFFGRLSIKQKKAFGQQYRDAIKQKVAEGYTVVTSNKSLLNDADVVVYNSSAEQTEERVNRADRALTNKYHALNYHRDTLTEIKELKDNDKENSKEYIELDKDHYLSDFISSRPSVLRNPSTNLYDNTKQEAPDALLEVSREKLITDFLNEFGISVHTISEYDGELPLFDALNRVINARNASEITDGVGYAIAFMMQGDSDVQRMIVSSHFGLRGNYGRKVPFTNARISNLHPTENSPIAREVLREIGKRISEELRNNFGTDIEEVKSRKTIWKVIKNFFKKLGMTIVNPLRRGSVIKREKILVRSVIDALGREDFSRIKGPRVKEDTTELAQRVGVEEALKENPYEDNIIRRLGEHGIALAGSTSIALQGSLFRPSENPLHDIDFDAGANSSKATIDKVLSKIFDKDTVQYSHSIHKKGKDFGTETYITLSVPFTLKKTGSNTAEFYGKDGKYLGRRKKSDLFLEDGIQGKMLDFFVGNTLGSKHGFYNRTINGHNYLISDSNAAIAAKILWARPKDMWDYKYFKRDSFQEVPADFIKSMSGKQIKNELDIIQQERADYNLINGIKEEKQHSGKAIPQDFTFADGTTIKAPFRPNEQQVDALNEMDSFIKSTDSTMTLSGYAGTGKTSLMEMIAKKMRKNYKLVYFCASTNKAAAVLNDRVSKAGFEAVTLNKAFGINVEQDSTKEHYDAKNLVNNLKKIDDIEIPRGSTVIIDEASMINEENYNILKDRAKQLRLKIIFVGDEAQLAPVNENKISKVFRNTDGKVVRLTQVGRTADNAILREATDIRNGKPLSGVSSFNSKGEGVAYITPEHQQDIDEVIQQFAPKLRSNPNFFRILAYTNKAVAAYNQKVREALGYTDPTPKVGEPMMGYTNWGYDWRTKSYMFINSESYNISHVGQPKRISCKLLNGTPVYLTAIPITLVDSFGKKNIFDYIDIKNNDLNRDAATQLAQEKAKLWSTVKTIKGKAQIPYYKKISEIEQFLFINDDIKQDKYTLQSKVIDFGYSMTVHKSQGSTFTHVLLDDVDIAKCNAKGNSTNVSISDVSLDEGTLDYTHSTLLNTTDVNPGDLGAVDSPVSDTISERQQLEYVGVSRATDTVTIISNGVKKEGSPLKDASNATYASQQLDISTISNNSASFGVTIDTGLKRNWQSWQQSNPNGIVAYRVNYNKYNTPEEANAGRIGNPFSEGSFGVNKGIDTVQKFYEWLVTGNNFNEPKATEEYRQAIINKLLSIDKPNILYYKELGRPSHATVLGYLIEHNDIINNNNEKEGYKPTDEFKRVQEAIRGSSKEKSSGHSVFTGYLTPDQRQRLADVLGRQLGSINSFIYGSSRNVSNTKHGTTFKIHYKVNPQLFHDVFEVVRYYTKNAELVDLHDDYSNCECYLTEDGTAGFAVEPDGNLVSVFNLGTTKGFLSAIKDLVREAGATHLDAYASSKQNLELMYAKTLGFHTASTMDYNMEYDHDDIAKNHGNPQVVFMVDHEVAEPKHFDKDSYDAAQQYQLAQLKQKQQVESTPKREWGRYSQNGYEVSTKGDSRFSALKATFKPGTILFGHDVSGRTIESVYQHGVKQGDWTTDNNHKTGVPKSKEIIKGNNSEASYAEGYLPLWKEWAKQNPELITELREKSQGKVLTDMFVNPKVTTVSQARALAEILDESEVKNNTQEIFINNLPTSENTSQQVSLPGYEYVRGLQESVSIDADWKLPILKELDSKIDIYSSYDEGKVFAQAIEDVLNATSEAEYKAKHKEKSKVEKIIAEYEKFNTHLNNLLDNEFGLKASEVRHAAQQVADDISDTITMLQKNSELVKIWFPTLETSLDFSKASREQILTTIGIEDLIQKVREDISNADYEDFKTRVQANLLIENWDALMTFASDAICFNEGVGINKDFTTGRWILTKSNKIDIDNFQDYSNDEDIAAENGERDSQEHWQVESRTVDVLNSMSALVRQGLHECYVLDADGNKKISKWGIPERVNPRMATNSILRWTQGTNSLEEMVSRLAERKANNPWVQQLIERLSDKSGAETDFQSQFYSVFTKDYQLYSAVLLEDGKYHSIPLNRNPALTETMQSLSAQFTIGALKLFNGSKINGELLGNSNTVHATASPNLYKAYTSLKLISDNLKHGTELKRETLNNAIQSITEATNILGINVGKDALLEAITPSNIHVMADNLGYIVSNLSNVHQSQLRGENKDYNPFKFKAENGIEGNVRKFLSPITSVMEDLQTNSFYDSGKMYQNYITPSFLSHSVKMFHTQDREKFEQFMMERYGNSTFYREVRRGPAALKGGWRTDWMRILFDKNDKGRQLLDHKVELNFNKHNYMRTMTSFEYTVSLITEYCSDANFFKGEETTPVWFRVPMQSNKPSSDFIKFYAYTGHNYKDTIKENLGNIFLQELDRIITVRARGYNKGDAEYIKNFDTNGRKFCFLPVLNRYLENTKDNIHSRDILKDEEGNVSADNERLAELLQKKVEASVALTKDENLELKELVEKVLYQYNEDRVQDILKSWQKEGIVKAVTKIKGIKDEEHAIKVIENFLWNDSYASKMILQLTIGDIAFYKDAEELQKRLSQLHAPGMRGRKEAIDYNGKRVSDGNYRTIILKDWDNFVSNIVDNINEVFNRKIAAAPKAQKASLIALKDSLTRPRKIDPETGKVLDKGGEYWNINVADAQGFSSPSSYRKKAFIFGRWSKEAERIYNNLIKGDVNMTDLQTAFQPLKPFVYALTMANMGVENAPINAMPAPFQAKNSEYLLIMADALMKNESLSRPNLLRAIYRVMEESEVKNPTKGLDTVQFESSIKSDLQGALDIHQFADNPSGEDAAYNYIMNNIYKEGTTEYDTDVFVKEMSYDNYCLQQEVPEHFKLHSQAHGSQIRMITPADLDFFTTDAQGNQVKNYYEWTEPDGTKRRVNAKEFKQEYEKTIADSIQSSIDGLVAELHLESESKKERNIALSKILQKEIASSPRYGIDLLQACAVDPKTGEFRIPKGDPIQAKRIEQLINSIIKNRVNKQKIAGGPIVQVSNFGTSKQLHIRFNDKKGNLIPLKEQYNPAEHKGMSYNEYLKENQGGIAYFEVYAPMWDNDLFAKFVDINGNIDIEAIEATDPELLKMVSYRIPTEDKYSCAPMKVVGFMPKEAGDAIMLPYELTSIDDSDFDIDKRYVMRKDLGPILTRSRKEIETKLVEKIEQSYAKSHPKELLKGDRIPSEIKYTLREQVKMFLDNPQRMKNSDALMQSLAKEYRKIAYYVEAPTSGNTYRNNKVVDMTYAVLTNEMTADKILNPGGFSGPKKAGYTIAAYKNPEVRKNHSWDELENMETEDLKGLSYIDKDLTFADTQVQFYKQNAAAGSLIGIFAVNKVAHAALEGDGIYISIDDFCAGMDFSIAGMDFKGLMLVDPSEDREGNLIGKTLGSLVSASADAVKDPILNLMNINGTTANILNTLIRLGMPFKDATLFLSQNILVKTITEFNIANFDNYVSLDSIVNEKIQALNDMYHFTTDEGISQRELSKEELIEGLTEREETEEEEDSQDNSKEKEASRRDIIEYKTLLAFKYLSVLAEGMRNPTFVTRFNSISSAVGPLIIDNLITENKVMKFVNKGEENTTGFYKKKGDYNEVVDISTILDDHPILMGFAKTLSKAKSIFMDMPAGSTGFRNLLKEVPTSIQSMMYRDKKLLSQFSDFYQSYLLMQSGYINPDQLKEYVEDFPKKFFDEKIKQKYADNEFIQAIKLTTKKSGYSYLTINITGMDEAQKETLRSAWIDLHKADPKLSKQLFDYSFFLAGVGFSPKTFMSLVPSYVKERLINKDNGATYIDTYRKFPEIYNNKRIIDQFVANNWNNNKLAPKKGDKDNYFSIDLEHGSLIVVAQKDMEEVAAVPYMKVKAEDGNTYLWKLQSADSTQYVYKIMQPLGGNGEYLEMSTKDISSPLKETTQTTEDIRETEISEVAPTEEEQSVTLPTSTTTKVKEAVGLVELLMKQNPSFNITGARNTAENIIKNPIPYKKFLQNLFFDQLGLKLSVEEALEELKKYC